jgi:fluoride ion exporter CrcB/FEX
MQSEVWSTVLVRPAFSEVADVGKRATIAVFLGFVGAVSEVAGAINERINLLQREDLVVAPGKALLEELLGAVVVYLPAAARV